MTVLLVTQYFHPEIGATQTRMMAFAQALVDGGHTVDVLTEFPNHPAGVIPSRYKGRWLEFEDDGSLRIVRVRVYATAVKTFWRRLAFYGSFFLMAVIVAPRLRKRYDCVAATTPPLPVAAAGLVLSRLKRAAFVMDVRDLWPLAAKALGELSNPRAYAWAERLERALYARAHRITVTTEAFARYIGQIVPNAAAAIEHVPNGTLADLFDPGRGDAGMRARYGAQNEFVVAYAGLLGIAQGLGVLLDAAVRLRGEPVRFLIVGEGPDRARLEKHARELGLQSVIFTGQVAPEQVAFHLNAADLVVVPLVPDAVFEMFVPSKMFDAMACARPVALMVPGEARDILDRAGGGVFVPPGDSEALSRTIRDLMHDRARCLAMGERGRRFVVDHYLRPQQARRFVQVLAAAAAAHGTGRSL